VAGPAGGGLVQELGDAFVIGGPLLDHLLLGLRIVPQLRQLLPVLPLDALRRGRASAPRTPPTPLHYHTNDPEAQIEHQAKRNFSFPLFFLDASSLDYSPSGEPRLPSSFLKAPYPQGLPPRHQYGVEQGRRRRRLSRSTVGRGRRFLLFGSGGAAAAAQARLAPHIATLLRRGCPLVEAGSSRAPPSGDEEVGAGCCTSGAISYVWICGGGVTGTQGAWRAGSAMNVNACERQGKDRSRGTMVTSSP
jgi:hypothetical protein